MSEQTQVQANHSMMQAWNAHKASKAYANCRRWAAHEQHVDGALWALFVAGWKARDSAATRENHDEQ